MSDLPTGMDPDIAIVAIEFSDNWEAMEITFIERRNVGPKAFKRETVSLDASLLRKEDVDDVFETVSEWRDLALLHIRTEGGE